MKRNDKVQCGLCLKDVPLLDSHLMPKALYRRLRKAFDGNDLVMAQFQTNSIFYTDQQTTHDFLCRDCENLFSQFGESRVIPDCYSGENDFPLLDWANSASSFAETESERWINPIENNHKKTDEYLYFAASIFWRSSAWPKQLTPFQSTLGAKYQEEFRKFLLGQEGFPKNAYLTVYIDKDKKPAPILTSSTSSKKQGYHHHLFYIPGMKFSMALGNQVGGINDICESIGSKLVFATYNFSQQPDYFEIVKNVKYDLKAKGRLARDRRR